MHPLGGLNTLFRGITGYYSRVMQSSINELSTPVAVKRICKQEKNNIYT